MKIQYVLEIIRSNPDKFGGTYCAFVLTFTETGECVRGYMGRGSGENVTAGLFTLNGKKHVQNHVTIRRDVPIREFNQIIKGWDYIDGSGRDFAIFFIMGKLKHKVGDLVIIKNEIDQPAITVSVTNIRLDDNLKPIFTVGDVPNHMVLRADEISWA